MSAPDAHADFVRRIDRNGWRLDALDEWRKDIDGRMAVMESEVATIRETRKMQEQLSLRHRRSVSAGTQFLLVCSGLVVAAAAVASFVLQAVHG